MPRNYPQAVRVLQIVAALERQRGCGLSVSDLAGMYRCTRRTILRDLDALQLAGFRLRARVDEDHYREKYYLKPEWPTT